MKTWLAIWMLLVSLPLLAEEECIFDQEAQKETHVELQKKYPGSRYIEEEYKLIIPKDGHQIILKRGGCAHFGITIELRIARTEEYEDEDIFFSKVLELVTEYGQELIDPKKLARTIKERRWQEIKQEEGTYYFLCSEAVTAFEVFRNHDREHTTIHASFYY
ncbi:MAG: hypothetical protein OES46_10280 [Gammaproteobacteria bacterium]|jgi:hypothetical protein|nr:hypothetical protein [Gammaproteobacteria bacterium]